MPYHFPESDGRHIIFNKVVVGTHISGQHLNLFENGITTFHSSSKGTDGTISSGCTFQNDEVFVICRDYQLSEPYHTSCTIGIRENNDEGDKRTAETHILDGSETFPGSPQYFRTISDSQDYCKIHRP